MDPCCRPDLAGVTYWSLDHPKATLTCLTNRQENISARPSLFVIVYKNRVHFKAKPSHLRWILMDDLRATVWITSSVEIQKNTTELPPHIHMTCADSLVVTYSRIFNLDPWMTRKPSEIRSWIIFKGRWHNLFCKCTHRELGVSHLYPTNRHVYFNTLVLCFNN